MTSIFNMLDETSWDTLESDFFEKKIYEGLMHVGKIKPLVRMVSVWTSSEISGI